MKQKEFSDKLLAGLLHDCFQYQPDNIDLERFPDHAAQGWGRKLKDKVLTLMAKAGFARRQFKVESATQALEHIMAEAKRYGWFYEALQDEVSRELLVALLKYRVLGPGHVRLPLNSPRYHELRAVTDARYLREAGTTRVTGWPLNLYEVDGRRGKIRLHLHSVGITTRFLLEHYAYREPGVNLAAGEGDVVIDCGGCWGDTALYFADKTGSAGKVFCFEFDVTNLEMLEKNLQLNPELKPQISVIRKALWDRSDEAINYVAEGPSTTLCAAGKADATQVMTLAIDDLAAREKLARVDFIKMDIEGAELRALQGAEQVLRRFRPTLAISLYHKWRDFYEIPEHLHSLNAGYRFYLGHYTYHLEETVLFATAREH